MTTRLSISPTRITPTPREIHESKLSSQNVERALYALHFDGLVVLENVVDHTHLSILNDAMAKDTEFLASLGEESPYNYHQGTSTYYVFNLQGTYNRIHRPANTFSFAMFS